MFGSGSRTYFEASRATASKLPGGLTMLERASPAAEPKIVAVRDTNKAEWTALSQ